jgi:hypothetical protein
MSDHTHALVPLESWSYNSPEIRSRQRSIDVGLLAEAFIYYESLLVNVTNQPQFAELLNWFIAQGMYDTFLALVRDGTIMLYDYSFATSAVLANGEYSIMNIQDTVQAQPNSFERRFLYHPDVQRVIKGIYPPKRLYEAFRGRVIEVKADAFGSAIENARSDFADAWRNALILQSFVDELYRFRGLGRPPEITVIVEPGSQSTKHTYTWNVNFDELAQMAGEPLHFHKGTPLTACAHCNRLLLSASQQRCDLYLGRPMSSLIGDKLYETVSTPIKLTETIGELQAEVEFPNVRNLVNNGKLTFKDVLMIRRKAVKFREWLQTESDRDRNAIIAYHHEVMKESGLTQLGRKTLSLFGILGGGAAGSIIGDVVAGPIGGAIGGAAGAGLTYLIDLAAKLGEDWQPVVFGDWMRDRIKKLLKERQK